MPADVGTGTTISYASWTGEIISITRTAGERASINTSHLGTTVAHTFRGGRLKDEGEYNVEFAYDPQALPPDTSDGLPVEVVITYPLQEGETTAAKHTFDAFITADDEAIPLEDKMIGNMTMKVSGARTFAAAT